jgi:hypothetical protein
VESKSGRLIPQATQSIVVILYQKDFQGNWREIKRTNPPVQRPQTTYKFEKIPAGVTRIQATAYPSTDGSGVALARGEVECVLAPGENVAPALTMDSTIVKVEITPPEATLSVGQTVQLTATAKDADGNIVLVPAGGFSWQSSNSAVAEVDSGGKVTAKAEGSATITATEKESGKSGSASIKVGTTPSVITFEKTFGSSGAEMGRSVTQTSDGGYIIVGTTWASGSGKGDIYLIKTDSQGNKLWEKTFGGDDIDEGYSVAQTSDGGYVIVGETWSFGSGLFDVYLIKTDSQGNKLWEKTFGGSDCDRGFSLALTTDGGYAIAGTTHPFYGAPCDFYLIKTDSRGNKMWEKNFGGSNSERGYSVAQTTDGGYILVGYKISYSDSWPDVYLIKTDSQGNKLWEKTFGGSNDIDEGYSVAQTSDGGYVIVGETWSTVGGCGIYLIKTDSRGNEVWKKIFEGYVNDRATPLAKTTDNGYVIVGGKDGDVYLIKTDSQGNKLWEKTFGGDDIDEGYSVAQTSDGGYVIVGTTKSFGSGGTDVYLIKTDSKGNVYNKGKCFVNPAVGNKPGSRGYNQMDRRERFGHRLGRD